MPRLFFKTTIVGEKLLRKGRLMLAVEVVQAQKYYGKKHNRIQVLNNINFSVRKGEIVGLIGLNGAGKSTLIKLMTGIIRLDSGSIRINGQDPFLLRRKVSKKIGVLFGQKSNLIYDLPLKDSFELLGTIYGIEKKVLEARIDYFDRYLGLADLLEKPVRSMSLGQRMKSEVASVLLHFPKIIFLDEAFLGIDFFTKKQIISIIKDMSEAYHSTFIITSHDLKDIERVCKRAIILAKGQIILDDLLVNILSSSETVCVEVEFEKEIKDEPCYQFLPDMSIDYIEKEENKIKVRINQKDLETFIRFVYSNGNISKFYIQRYNLEDVIEDYYSFRSLQ